MTKLRDKLIEKLVTAPAPHPIATGSSYYPDLIRGTHDMRREDIIEAIVDAILTTLADEEPDEAMIKSVDVIYAKSIWGAMTAALRDSAHD